MAGVFDDREGVGKDEDLERKTDFLQWYNRRRIDGPSIRLRPVFGSRP